MCVFDFVATRNNNACGHPSVIISVLARAHA